MKIKTLVVTGALAFALAATPAAAKTFRYAFQGDLNALDPYTLNESFTLGALGNVMEGLTKRDKDLKIIPGLAERWEIVDPLIRAWEAEGHPESYPKGSWGPHTADDLVASSGAGRWVVSGDEPGTG